MQADDAVVAGGRRTDAGASDVTSGITATWRSRITHHHRLQAAAAAADQ